MKYMGSKRRIAKYIAPIIQGFIESGNYKTYIEPFVGGANMIEYIKCQERCGSDINKYLIAALTCISESPEQLPDMITETMYQLIKNHPDGYPAHLVGYAGFAMSFGGKYFGGYRRDKAGSKGCIKNMATQSRRSKQAALKQHPLIEDVRFTCHSYKNWAPENCVVYCDPPYQGVTKYKDKFNHVEFWNWCQKYAELQYNNVILVSEYVAPSFCTEVIWQKEIENTLAKDTKGKKGIEKLFWVKP
jgi:DNA adenine methylase